MTSFPLSAAACVSAVPPLQALAQAASSGGKGQQAVASVIAEAFASGGTASATAEAVAQAYSKNKGGVSTALAQALATANSDSGKTQAAASAVAEVRGGAARQHPPTQSCTVYSSELAGGAGLSGR